MERWDSLRLLTPNWQSRLPGHRYNGDDPDGFMAVGDVVDFIETYADRISAPVETRTTVTCVEVAGQRYRVDNDRGSWRCRPAEIGWGDGCRRVGNRNATCR